MAAQHSSRHATCVRIFCPVQASTLALLVEGQLDAVCRDKTLSAILGVIRANNLLGDFELYKSVVEISPGWEMFTPETSALPAMGEVGSTAVSPTAILTVHIPADTSEDEVSRALDEILSAHPWEVPVIELTETRLVTRG